MCRDGKNGHTNVGYGEALESMRLCYLTKGRTHVGYGEALESMRLCYLTKRL